MTRKNAPLISAKECIGIEDVLKQVIELLPAPKGDFDKPFKALIFDSYYDSYKGAISFIRVFDGEVKAGDRIRMCVTGKEFDVTEVGVLCRKCKRRILFRQAT